jgi:hypothetical protein
MDDATVLRRQRSPRFVQQQRPHQQDVARLTAAVYGATGDGTVNILTVQSAGQVRPRNDPQRPIIGTTRIKMNSHRYHLRQQFSGWLHGIDAILHRPRPIALDLFPPRNRYRKILMPGNRPIVMRRLVEQDAPHHRDASGQQQSQR